MASSSSSNNMFKLQSCRYARRLDELYDDLKLYWLNYLQDIMGYSEVKVENFFVKRKVDCEYAVEEIRICYWSWIDQTGLKHELLDMNAWPWPGDNEDGLVVVDGQIILDNCDTDLSPFPEADKNMAEQLQPFQQVREIVYYPTMIEADKLYVAMIENVNLAQTIVAHAVDALLHRIRVDQALNDIIKL